jgi:hypothetical protein
MLNDFIFNTIEHLTVMKIQAFLDVTLCHWADISLCFEGTQCPYLQWSDYPRRMTALPLKMKASGFSGPRRMSVWKNSVYYTCI